VDAGGVDGFGQGQIGQDGGAPARQHRLPCAWGAEQQDIMVRTPASVSALRCHLEMTAAREAASRPTEARQGVTALWARWRCGVGQPSGRRPARASRVRGQPCGPRTGAA
jgi:hypothetical protein